MFCVACGIPASRRLRSSALNALLDATPSVGGADGSAIFFGNDSLP
jgi:hypothetical protein